MSSWLYLWRSSGAPNSQLPFAPPLLSAQIARTVSTSCPAAPPRAHLPARRVACPATLDLTGEEFLVTALGAVLHARDDNGRRPSASPRFKARSELP